MALGAVVMMIMKKHYSRFFFRYCCCYCQSCFCSYRLLFIFSLFLLNIDSIFDSIIVGGY